MLELILLRHAKSDWDASFGSDRDRPLNKRGQRSARAVGRFLTDVERAPDLVLTSPAVRAHTTALLAIEAGAWDSRLDVREAIYGGGPDDLLAEVAGAPEVRRVMVVGHEPTLSTTATRLIGGGLVRMPTAVVAEFRLAGRNWSEVRWGGAELVSLVAGRSLLGTYPDA